MKYYLGPWTWITNDGPHEWRGPAGRLHTIDLRPIPAQATPIVQSGYGLFGMPDDISLDSDYRLFGEGQRLTEIVPKESDRSVFASMVGVQTVDGSTLAEWMYSLLTLYSDVSGDTAVRPLMPMTSGRLGACGIAKQFDLNMPEAAKVIANLQADYRQLYADARDGKFQDELQHLRVLDYWGKQFKVDNPEDIFIPADLPREKPVKHATTITDDFTRANADPMGSSSEGWSWTEVVGDFDINTNAVRSTLVDQIVYDNARAESDLSSSNHYAQATINYADIVPYVTFAGTTVRFDSSAVNAYGGQVRIDTANPYLRKWTAGTSAQLATAVTVDMLAPGVLRTVIDGSTLSVLWNGVSKLSVSDTTFSGGTRCGINTFKATQGYTIHDDWSAADLAAAAVHGRLYYDMLIGGSNV